MELDKSFTRSPNVNNKLTKFGREALIHILHDPRMADLSFPERRKILIKYFQTAPSTDMIVKSGNSTIDYSILVASQSLFEKDYNDINANYFDGSLDYSLWYKKQIHAFDMYAKSISDTDTLDASDLKLAQRQFWLFFQKVQA